MKLLSALAMALSVTFAHAEELEPVIIRNGNDFVRLTKDACTPNLPSFRTGTAVLDGTPYKLCWKIVQPPEGKLYVVVVYEDGDVWKVDPYKFRPESEVPAGL